MATIRSFGAARINWLTIRALAASTCSQLSNIRSMSRAWNSRASVSTNERPNSSRKPNTRAISGAISAPSATAANSTHHTPSGTSLKVSAASCMAKRVLPQPPAPVSVTSRCCRIACSNCCNSSTRPTKLDRRTGRLVGSAPNERRGGKSATASMGCSCQTRSGKPRSFKRCTPRSRSAAPAGLASPSA